MCANVALSDSEKPGLGLKIVSMAPTRYAGRPASFKKQALAQQSEKLGWKGVDISFIGTPEGLDRSPLLPSVSQQECRSKALLHSLFPDFDSRPPLQVFSPVKDLQLLPDVPASSRPSAVSGHDLAYKLYHAESRLVRSTLEQSGFGYTDSHTWNVLWSGTAPPKYLFEGLYEYQKINHYPRSEELTRKDRLAANVNRMRDRFGKEVFDFLPETFRIPEESEEFRKRFEESPGSVWIAKPNASSQGKGIFLVEKPEDVEVAEAYIVSRYISNPLLVNRLKFDLRVYVLVTSYDPLRIYVYEEGLARFACEEYESTGHLDNKFMHLTNYSVNKKSEKFIQNQDYKKDNVGHKWSLSALCEHLRAMSVDTDLLWLKIYDSIIKSLLSIEESVIEASLESSICPSNCFDLFGFDILIDSNLKPWVLEVNLSPSLGTDSPLDLYIKGHLIADVLNLVGVRGFDRRKEGLNYHAKARFRAKRTFRAGQFSSPNRSPIKAFENSLSQRQRCIARDTLEEYLRRSRFLRIYPSKGCECYSPYFAVPRPATSYVLGLLFGNAECDLHPDRPLTGLLISASDLRTDNCDFHHRTVNPELRPASVTCGKRRFSTGRVQVICEEEVLVEYVARLIGALVKINEKEINGFWRKVLETFVTHPTWLAPDQPREALWRRMELRYTEMRDKRPNVRPSAILCNFSNIHIEDYLRKLPAGRTRELVLPLLRRHAGGVLTEISQIRSHTMSQGSPAPHHESDEEGELAPFNARKRSLEHMMPPSTLRQNLRRDSSRPRIRKMTRSVKR